MIGVRLQSFLHSGLITGSRLFWGDENPYHSACMPVIVCERCGYEWSLKSTRQKTVLCAGCRAKKVATVHRARSGKCLPWQGMFLGEVSPIFDDGRLVLPGVRTCGHSDCVNANHVVGLPGSVVEGSIGTTNEGKKA